MMAGKLLVPYLLLAAFILGQPKSATAADDSTGPKISQVRVGFQNRYKLGFWIPVVVDVAGATEGLRIEVIASDSDGVATTAYQLVSDTESPEGVLSATVYTLVGRVVEPIRIVLRDEERIVDELTLKPTIHPKAKEDVAPLAATSELLVSLGSAAFGLRDAFPDREESPGQPERVSMELTSVAQLPDQWYGYDSVDVLLISGANKDVLSELARDKNRSAALQHWVENGGRLVVFCSGDDARDVLAADGPLAALVPGKLADVVRLSDAGVLEHFASTTTPVGNAAISAPLLTDVTGKIESYAGRRPADLPLVIRAPRGFGEVTFVGVDFGRPPLNGWAGRNAFLQAVLRPYFGESMGPETSARLATSGFNDLSGALRQQLGRSFSSVKAIGFPVVATLAMLYLAFLGPLDYLFVHRWLRRPLAAWITFPAIVIAFSLVSLAVANRFRGNSSTQINRINLIDVDVDGHARGMTWAVLYSPEARRFSPQFKRPATIDSSKDSTVLFSWWGLPGSGIGGMQSTGSDLGIFQDGYRFGAQKDSLEGVPVLSSATKAFMGRYTGTATTKIAAELTDVDGLAAGSVTNETGKPLRNARLLYGSWAYRLGTLRAGQRVDIGDELSPRRAKTIVTRDALGESGATAAQVEGRVFDADRASPIDLLNLMMFYETAGGYGFAHVPNRYQGDFDLSRQLELGRAVLVAESATESSSIVDQETGQPLVDDTGHDPSTVYRYILPVERPAAQ